MLSQQCDLIEQLDATNQSNIMHAQIRKNIGEHKGNATTTCIEDKDGSISMDQENMRTRWFEYISERYKDDSRGQLPHITPDTAGISITSEEIQHALKRMPMKDPPGPDGVLTEMLVAAGEYGLEELTRITNMVCNHGYFPGELNISIFITLPKISGLTKCEKHRTINLMSHFTRLIICVVMNRVLGRTLQEITPEQYGFMPDKRTRNARCVLRRRSEREIEKQKDIYACFIDYSKTFDTEDMNH